MLLHGVESMQKAKQSLWVRLACNHYMILEIEDQIVEIGLSYYSDYPCNRVGENEEQGHHNHYNTDSTALISREVISVPNRANCNHHIIKSIEET